MFVDIFSGRLRIRFEKHAIEMRVLGESADAGGEEALAEIERIEAGLKRAKVRHITTKRKHGDGYRTDALVIPLIPDERSRTERRQTRRRRSP